MWKVSRGGDTGLPRAPDSSLVPPRAGQACGLPLLALSKMEGFLVQGNKSRDELSASFQFWYHCNLISRGGDGMGSLGREICKEGYGHQRFSQ